MKYAILFLATCCGMNSLLFAQNYFEESASTLGIEHSYGSGVAGGGVSFCDFTGDGLDDLTIATQTGDLIHFYENIGGEFIELPALVNDTFQTKQILWVDFDNDGDNDLYLSNYDGINRLYLNDGALNLTDITESAGLPMDVIESFGACWGDVNRDGWLDIYFTKRRLPFATNQAWLYLNDGDGTFSDATIYCGVSDPEKAAFMPVFLDINHDLWPDIYTAHDKTQINTLLRNNADLTFSDISQSSQADVRINAMGLAIGDYDNDTDLDIYVSNTPDGNKLLNNSGNEMFEEIADLSGVGFYGTGWGANFLDADNDTDLDLYVSGMYVGTDRVSSLFYENLGNAMFNAPEANFIADTVSSFANAVGDFNEDGYPDIVVNNTAPFSSQLWVNSAQDMTNNFLKIKLSGVVSNRAGIGSWISVFTNGNQQVRYTHCGISYLGQNSDTELFGLGSSEIIDSIHIEWPTGHVDRYYQIEANQKLILIEGTSTGREIYVDPATNVTITFEPMIEEKGPMVTIAPNPSSGNLLLNSQEYDINKVQIISQNGQLLFQKDIIFAQRQISIDLELPSGIYFVRVENKLGNANFVRWSVVK